MVKLLIFGNLPVKEAEKTFNTRNSFGGNWMNGYIKSISSITNIKIFYAFPLKSINKIITKKVGNISYIAYPFVYGKFYFSSHKLFPYLKKLKSIVNPNLVHVFGTEFPIAYYCLKVFGSNKVIISLQGIINDVKKNYFSDLPLLIRFKITLYELVSLNSLLIIFLSLKIRSFFELKALSNGTFFIGRTDYDYSFIKLYNTKFKYFNVYEPISDEFKNETWSIQNVERNSIYFSQAFNPIKGFHIFLKTLSRIVKIEKNIKVYVSGYFDANSNTFKKTTYSTFIHSIIKKNNLKNHIVFLGYLNSNQLSKYLLKSNVFVNCSLVENSSNSITEALSIGVPVIASNAGGIQNFIRHGENGLIFNIKNSFILDYYILKLFNSDHLASSFSHNSRNFMKNYFQDDLPIKMKNIYYDIYEKYK